MGRDILQQTRLLTALSNLALNTSRYGVAMTSLGTALMSHHPHSKKNFFFISNLNLPSDLQLCKSWQLVKFGFPLKHPVFFTFRARIVKRITFGNNSLIFSIISLGFVWFGLGFLHICGKVRMQITEDSFSPFSHSDSVYKSGQYLVSKYDTAVSSGLSSAPGQKAWLC